MLYASDRDFYCKQNFTLILIISNILPTSCEGNIPIVKQASPDKVSKDTKHILREQNFTQIVAGIKPDRKPLLSEKQNRDFAAFFCRKTAAAAILECYKHVTVI